MDTANLMEKEVYADIKKTLINLNIEEYEIYVSTEVREESNTVYFEEIRALRSIPGKYHHQKIRQF